MSDAALIQQLKQAIVDEITARQDVLLPLKEVMDLPSYAEAMATAIADKVASSVVIADAHYVHAQGEAATTWTVTHNLGKIPSVSVVDSAGTIVHGSVKYVSNNELTITFSSPFGGRAILN